ncbi:DUF6538 domain-containing protein [Ochrobactrum sp. WV_118_8]|uniref:Site-specific integrase n=1 Tax=Brucella anthropi TaxID=529 RepID=A0A6L3ZCI9_BRUAN|nr:DUF6538 domain-containing protein [Brucella anthropi]KAB2773597.1 site-specific integrase [Brucella anthropi]
MKRTQCDLNGLYMRKGTYYYRKAIPHEFHALAGKREIFTSLKTKDETIALEKLAQARRGAEAVIFSLKAGTYTAQIGFKESSDYAASQGRELKCLSEILEDQHQFRQLAKEVLQHKKKGKVNLKLFKSFVNIKKDDKSLCELIDLHFSVNAYRFKELNYVEKNKKLNPIKNTVQKFTEFLGVDDISVSELNRQHARDFRNHLKSLVLDDEIVPNTANKHFINLRKLLNTYYDENGINPDINPFRGMRLEGDSGKRVPLTVDHIKSKWLNNSVFDGLSDPLHNLLWAMIDTGCGFKELCGLDPKTDIKLNDEIPHIVVRANDHRQLKTTFRERHIPLAGLALNAFRNCPDGFPHYRGPLGPTNASAALNKFLNSHGLFDLDGQSVYSLRHCFKDRLRRHKVPEGMQDFLMGHKSSKIGDKYGNGYELDQYYEVMLELAKDFQ